MAYVNLTRRGFVAAAPAGLSAFINVTRGMGAARPRSRVLSDLYPRRSWRRGISGFGPRGLGLSFPQVMVPVPQPAPFPPTQMPTAETSVANAAAQLANAPTTTAEDYPNLAAITANLISYGQTLCSNSWAPYTCQGFDPVAVGTKYANLAWAALQTNISPVSGKPNYNPAPGAVAPPSTPPVYQAPYNPASVPGSSALPTPPQLVAPPSQYASDPAPGSPAWYAAHPGAGAGTNTGGSSSQSSGTNTGGSSSQSSGSNTGPAAPAPNWPLIGGAAALALAGLFFLGGSK